tara:strand:- start:1505 stop:1669 length:165 start_codon:yes stop_codon:yes gene_type:complete
VSSRGRVLKKTGMDDKKLAAIREMGELHAKGLKRSDQYQVSYNFSFFKNFTRKH